jgi:hypothetical protein
MTMLMLHPPFCLLNRVRVVYIQLSELRCSARSWGEGADAMYQLATNAESINTVLSSDRVIDMDAEGGEGESVIIVANMLAESNALYTSANTMDLEHTRVCPR